MMGYSGTAQKKEKTTTTTPFVSHSVHQDPCVGQGVGRSQGFGSRGGQSPCHRVRPSGRRSGSAARADRLDPARLLHGSDGRW